MVAELNIDPLPVALRLWQHTRTADEVGGRGLPTYRANQLKTMPAKPTIRGRCGDLRVRGRGTAVPPDNVRARITFDGQTVSGRARAAAKRMRCTLNGHWIRSVKVGGGNLTPPRMTRSTKQSLGSWG
jgi:hypothetical protein